MNTLTSKKSTDTYIEQDAIKLHFWDILNGEAVVGRMKADHRTITQRTYSGYIVLNGEEIVCKGEKSMKNVLANLNEAWSNSTSVEAQIKVSDETIEV